MELLEDIFTERSDVMIAKAVIKMGGRRVMGGGRRELAGKEQAVSELMSRAGEFGLPKDDATRVRYESVITCLKKEGWINFDESAKDSLIETTNDGWYLFKGAYGTLWEP